VDTALDVSDAVDGLDTALDVTDAADSLLDSTDDVLDSADSTDGSYAPRGFFAQLFAFIGEVIRFVIQFVVNVIRGFIELIFPQRPPGTGGGWWEL
jgi:hypothetical protein